jgi:hypothetical protein
MKSRPGCFCVTHRSIHAPLLARFGALQQDDRVEKARPVVPVHVVLVPRCCMNWELCQVFQSVDARQRNCCLVVVKPQDVDGLAFFATKSLECLQEQRIVVFEAHKTCRELAQRTVPQSCNLLRLLLLVVINLVVTAQHRQRCSTLQVVYAVPLAHLLCPRALAGLLVACRHTWQMAVSRRSPRALKRPQLCSVCLVKICELAFNRLCKVRIRTHCCC